MKPVLNHVVWDHGVFGVLASLAVTPFFGWTGGLVFFLASILIDLDHYIFFIRITGFRRWNPADMFRFFEELGPRCRSPGFLKVEYFHNIEFFALFGCCALAWKGLWVPAFWGLMFHTLTDIRFLTRGGILSKRCHSVVEYFWRLRELRKQGLDPGVVYRDTLKAAGLLPEAERSERA